MSYNYDSIVSKNEADALKEMIFKRVRERAAALNEETQNSYTTSFKNEIMDIARQSFIAEKNPFSVQENTKVEENEEDNVPEKVKLAIKHSEEIKEKINYWNKIADENIANESARTNMYEARESLKKNTGFLGALDFLNSQATISLVSKNGSVFNAVA